MDFGKFGLVVIGWGWTYCYKVISGVRGVINAARSCVFFIVFFLCDCLPKLRLGPCNAKRKIDLSD
ncbi:hypothetical protein C1X56_14050 [Pseudomonas sp. GW101-1A09]|nr:hypothetical protein C1X56_14050 [Pseudomonas sp. GW101-1A09]